MLRHRLSAAAVAECPVRGVKFYMHYSPMRTVGSQVKLTIVFIDIFQCYSRSLRFVFIMPFFFFVPFCLGGYTSDL